MGLDVYLYKANKETLKVAEDNITIYEKYADELWGDHYSSMTDEQKENVRKKIQVKAKKLGLDEDGSIPNTIEISCEQESELHPKHSSFKIGYFRSSYNEGGMNHILRQITGEDLYDIFNPNDNDYRVYPDWDQSKEKALALLSKLKKFSHDNGDLFLQPILKFNAKDLSEKEVMDLVITEKNRKHPFLTYSNSDGLFSFDRPLAVVAVIDTKDKVYLAIKGDMDNNPSEGFGWYIQALEIVVETIDYVLAQPDKEDYYFHWSS